VTSPPGVHRPKSSWRLWIVGMLLVVLVLWGLTGWYILRDRRQQLEFAATSARIQVQLLAEHTAATFRHVELALRTYPGGSAGSDGCSNLRRTVLDLPGVDNAVVLAPDGSVTCSLRPPTEGEFPFGELLRRHRDEMLSFWIIPTARNRRYITLSIRFDDGHGAFAGIIAATIPSDYFTARFHDYGTVNAELIAIYDENRDILTRWPGGGEVSGQIGAEPLLAGLPEKELVSGGLQSRQTEHTVLAIFQLPGFAYRIVIANGLKSVLERWRSHSSSLGAVVFVLGVTITAAGIWIRWAGERRRHSEEELAASRGREQESRISRLEGLRTLAGGLAHSINNRMMVIFGNSQLLESTSNADSHVLHSIQEAARQTSALSERMLSVAGQTSLTISVFDVAELLFSREQDIRKLSTERVEVCFDLGSPPYLVDGDTQLLYIAIQNLVENAREAVGASGGRITITVCGADGSGVVHGNWSEEIASGAYVAISVTDNGEGMDESHRERVFDPFFSARFLGRGLGLSAVAGIARQHGGTVAIQSEPGHGTTVTIYIPSAKETSKNEPRKTERSDS
jgi:signal transduction histidine kinase